MGSGRNVIQSVVGSSVRSDVLRGVADGWRTRERLLETIDASKSAVYEAVKELDQQGLVHDQSGELQLTGAGRQLVDLLVHLEDTETLLADDEDYWKTHDTSVLPRRFRVELPALAGCHVVRATDTDPHRVVRTIAERIETAERVSIITPIYQDEFAGGLAKSRSVRLLMNRAIVEQAQNDQFEGGIEPPDNTTIRACDIDFALTVTEDCVMLSLPDLGGSYDARSELIAEHDRALDWGERLFEWYWSRSDPVEPPG
jgi:predicted transcriptional regulator